MPKSLAAYASDFSENGFGYTVNHIVRPMASPSPISASRLRSDSSDVKMYGDGEQHEPENAWEPLLFDFLGFATSSVLLFLSCFSVVYGLCVVPKIPTMQTRLSPGQIPERGLCECCGNCNLCLSTCCCFASRVGHNAHASGVMNYWSAIACDCFSTACGCKCCFLTWLRNSMRKNLGHQDDLLGDCCVTCCCAPCSVGQMALEVDQATGVDNISCCCDVSLSSPILSCWQAQTVPVMHPPAQVVSAMDAQMVPVTMHPPAQVVSAMDSI
jgi:Cys-rich protein (TIGR01571 family)